MSSEKKPQPVAWRHTIHMDGGQTAVRLARAKVDRPWGDPGIDFDESFSVTIEPLYSEATIEALGAERDGARKDIEAFWKPQFDEQVERAETAEARVAQLEAALAKIDRAITAGITETNGPARIKAPGDTRIEDGWIVGQFAIQFDLAMKGVRSIASALLSDGGRS